MSFACSFARTQDRETKIAPPMPRGYSEQTFYVLNGKNKAMQPYTTH
jgi:hypothetical protein